MEKTNIKDNKIGERVGIISIVLNLLLSVPKMILGGITNSVALFTDGVNNASDCLTGVITLVGMKASKKPRDIDHPYGHEKAEYITGFIIALLTAVVGFEFLTTSIKSIFNPRDASLDTISRIFLAISMLLKAIFVEINRRAFKKTQSTVFKANKEDASIDIAISAFILISSYFFVKYPWLDAFAGIVVSLLILYNAFSTVKDTISPILGEAPRREDIKLIREAVLSSKYVSSLHNLYVDRRSMDSIFATVDVEVEPELTIGEVHDDFERITATLRRDHNVELVIHIEPKTLDEKRTNIKKKLLNLTGVLGVSDILIGTEGEDSFVTISITPQNLEHKDDIKKECLEILNEEEKSNWIVDIIVSFS
ncbi:MAG: cation diffusion facilitator family transporter [Ezakiella sp.]|nr:cation diffusion facilitator family transporter [Ezakiella sp.]